MSGPSLVVTRRLPQPVEAVLSSHFGAYLSPDDHQFTQDELRAAMREYDIVLCTLGDRMGADVLHVTGRRAQYLANFGVGTNHLDLVACRSAGIAVSNTPGVLTDDTADLTMLLLLAVARRAWEGDRELRAGQWTGWRPTHMLGRRVSGKTLGIIGMGRIGQAVAHRAHHGFGMSITYWSRSRLAPDAEQALGATWCPTRDGLLASADFVSIHCPATADTRHLVDATALAAMRPGAYLVNTSRGDVVDEAALLAALDGGRLAGAALDVFEGEPAVNPVLLASPRVVTLPHLGSATEESRVAMGNRVLANLEAWIAGRSLPDRVV